MPFTFSHPAIVLPLRLFSKKYTSLTGLVVGSVTPDFEYFLRMKIDSQYSHTFFGMFWFDLPLGLVLAFIFHGIVRDPLIVNLPAWFQRRVNSFRNFDWTKYFFKNWLLVLISLMIGIASHLFWDGFTHKTGYFVFQFSFLSNEIVISGFHLAVYNILQHTSTLMGAAIILFAIKSMPEKNNTSIKPNFNYWLFSVLIMLIVVGLGKVAGQDYQVYGQLFITGISGGLIGLILTSVFWKNSQTTDN